MKRVILLLLLLLGPLAVLALSQTAHAGVTGFVAGRIIDDAVFTNTASMSANDIQVFLNSKVPTCDTSGTQMYNSSQTRAQFAATIGQYPPFTCLKDYSENGASAAQIIYNIAQQYSINPQVLIVLLQKEQGLVTDTWPYVSQYQKATGYGCPDTAACNSIYYGFTNQLTRAANMYRKILDNSPDWYTPYILGSNYIQYSPNTACGGSMVNIQNRATQALYNYTPYQPNQASLDAGWGTAPCGAYGNRNFYLYFTNWFGSTLAPDYSWQLVNQYVYTDSTKTTPAGLNNLLPGERRYVGFTLKNTGNVTWTNAGANPLNLGSSNPYERTSQFYDTTWLSRTRPATLREASVAPGETGTFEFWITAPAVTSTTTFNEYFTPLAEGRVWLPNIGLFYGITVQKPVYTWSLASQYAYTDSTKSTLLNMNSLLPGQRAYVGFTAKNTGNMSWKNSGANALMVGTLSPFERQSKFSTGSDWLTGTRPTLMKEASVAPGEIGTFEFWMTVPSSGVIGVYNERFGLIANDLTWLNDTGLSYYMNIQ